MLAPVPINLIVEDSLSEAVVRKTLAKAPQGFAIGVCYGRRGVGYIKKSIRGFNNAAKTVPYVVLVDLDRSACAPALVDELLPAGRHPNLLLRVAVREVEAWLLAHSDGIARFLGIRRGRIPADPDNILDPKELLVNLARRARNRDVRYGVVPRVGSSASVGPDYNGQLISFVDKIWDPDLAAANSRSLSRFRAAVAGFRPVWP